MPSWLPSSLLQNVDVQDVVCYGAALCDDFHGPHNVAGCIQSLISENVMVVQPNGPPEMCEEEETAE